MITFFDTSVLIGACQRTHVHHDASLNAFAEAGKARSACAVHTLAEIYAVTTGMPGQYRIPPEYAWMFLEQVRERCRLIALDEETYLEVLQAAVALKHPGGIIYDALLLACARKAKASSILTWNVKHFRMAAPDLADRIVTP